MTDYEIPDLTSNTTYYDGILIETWYTGWPESKKTALSVLTSSEATARAAADNTIIAGLGNTGAGGAYVTDETTNYIKAADFAAHTPSLTPNQMNADHLLDDAIKAVANIVAGFGTLLIPLAVRVSAAEMKALKFIQKTLIPAPGAGKFIQLVHATAFLDYGTAAFSFGYGLDVSYDDTIDPPNAKIGSFTQAFAESSADAFEVMSNVGTVVTWFENSAVVLSCEDTSAVGDSAVNIYLIYRVTTL